MKQRHYYLAFIVYVHISFIAQFFILNRILWDGLGTGLITLFLFSLGLGNSLFYLLFLPAKAKLEPKIVRFFILFLPGFYLISSLLGGGPTFFLLGLLAIPSNALVYGISMGLKRMLIDLLESRKAKKSSSLE